MSLQEIMRSYLLPFKHRREKNLGRLLSSFLTTTTLGKITYFRSLEITHMELHFLLFLSSHNLSLSFFFFFFFFFLPWQGLVEVPGPGIEPTPQQGSSYNTGSLTHSPQGNSFPPSLFKSPAWCPLLLLHLRNSKLSYM